MSEKLEQTPVTPLPNPGEGGPVYDGADTPAVPLPDPGEGGPTYDDASTPVVPLPNPGEGGPVYGGNTSGGIWGGTVIAPIRPWYAQVRFLNAARGYQPFRVRINAISAFRWLSFAGITAYTSVPAGYQTVTVSGPDGYIYLQKSLPFQLGTKSTVAIINTATGLDLLQIADGCCAPTGGYAAFRVSNLALDSRPMDVLLGDGRVIYADVQFKETTVFKRLRPGAYQFLFAETDLTPMPTWLDIETLDSAFLGTASPVANTAASLYLNASAGLSYTVFLLSSGNGGVQTLVATGG